MAVGVYRLRRVRQASCTEFRATKNGALSI